VNSRALKARDRTRRSLSIRINDNPALHRRSLAFSNPRSDVHDTPESERGAAAERPLEQAPRGGTICACGSFRELELARWTRREQK